MLRAQYNMKENGNQGLFAEYKLGTPCFLILATVSAPIFVCTYT